MRKLQTHLAVVLLLAAGAALVAEAQVANPSPPTPQAPPSQAAAPAMQPYVSSEGRFSVLFPGGNPKRETQQITLKGGDTTTL
jgi:hypothetical protein